MKARVRGAALSSRSNSKAAAYSAHTSSAICSAFSVLSLSTPSCGREAVVRARASKSERAIDACVEGCS